MISGPTIGRRRVRMALRRLRVAAGRTQEQTAAEMDWSVSKLIRIENGSVTISVSDLRSLLAFYRLGDQEEFDELLALARAAKRRAWFDDYRHELPASLLSYVGFEAEATEIKYFQAMCVPGLLQTGAYARAVLTELLPEAERPALDRRVDFRLRRQRELFDRPDPPLISAVIDEGVLLRRPDGSVGLLREQLQHLAELAARPGFTIRVLPFTAGAHHGWDGSFSALEFGDDDQVLYAENNPNDALVLWEDQEVVDRFREIFDGLVDRSCDPDTSIAMIMKTARELG